MSLETQLEQVATDINTIKSNVSAVYAAGIAAGGDTGVGEKYLVNDVAAGEIFNDYENNKAVSEYSHASGSNTHAGHYAFSFKEHEYTEADYDTTNNIGKYYLNTVEGITVGLNYTIVLNNNFGYQGVVNSVGEDYIEVSNYLIPNSDSTKTIYYDSSYIIFPDKPTIQGDMLIGYAAHSEGYSTNAMGISSHAEGGSTIASGQYSHAEGRGSKAGGYASHAETSGQALGHGSHAEGGNTKATGVYSHAEGSYTNATGSISHAEGESCLAAGKGSHAEGIFAKAHGEAQHVQGRYNVIDYENKYAHIVGNGTSVTGEDGKEIRTLSNAHTLDWEGNAWFAGDVVAGDVSLQSLMPTVITSSESTIVYNFSNRKNKVSQEDEIISISFDFGNEVYDRLYGSELSFDSGATPTSVDYAIPEEPTQISVINWVGVDCASDSYINDNGETVSISIFQPSANTHYDIVFYFNGKQFIGLVNGYVPAGGNEAV